MRSRPVAIEVFDGDPGDPKTLTTQIEKLKQRFGLDHVVLVGDRDMATQARLNISKHFDSTINDTSLTFACKTGAIAADGKYVVRTSLASEVLDDVATVRSYKSLSQAERAFRCIKTVGLQVRPAHHWLAGRGRAHVFLCMLGYYLEWHTRRSLAPLLLDDTGKDAAEAL